MNKNVLNNCDVGFHTRILKLSYSNLVKFFSQKLSRSNRNIRNRKNNNAPPNERHVSAPNRLLLKRHAVLKMSLHLCLIACIFGVNLNEIFEEEEISQR